MGIDERDEHPATLGRELQTACDFVGEQRAGLLVVAGVRGLAGIVEQHREVEDRGIFELLKNRAVALQPALVGKKDGIEFFDADECVFVGGVAVVELVLNEAIKRAELGDVAAQHAEVVHEAENAADLALPRKNGEESLPRGGRVLEGPVDQMQAARNEIDQLGVKLELTNLGVVECAQKPVGIVVKNLARLGNQLAVANEETVELFGLRLRTKQAEKA